MPDPQRSARGRHRRQVIVTAAGQVLMEAGFAGLSHRAVAERAGVPLAATTYYFQSLEALLSETVRELAERWLAAARAVVDDLPSRLSVPGGVAAAILRIAAPGDGAPPITMYERYLQAARHPSLRSVIVDYDAQVDLLLGEILRRGGVDSSPTAARLVLAVADGAMLRALAEGRPPSAVGTMVEQIVLRLVPAPQT